MKTIRWGIIGVGDVTEVKSGPPLYKCDHSELVAVMRRNGDKAKDFAERHHVPRWYDNGDDLINDPEVDIVYIATPTHVHKSYAIQAAQAGKHVYCEKPMGLSFAECQAMITACKDAGVSLWVAYYRRAMPRFLKIKSLIDEGAIGDVAAVCIEQYKTTHIQPNTPEAELHWHHIPEISGGGAPVDVGCHQIDLLNYWFGNISDVKGYASNQRGLYRSADNMSATFRFESGIIGTAIWNFAAGINHEVMTIAGTEGELRFSVFSPTPIILTNAERTQTIEHGYPEHVHQPLIETIIAELNGQGKCPSTGLSASHTTWVTDQIFAEFQTSFQG
jgi:predicted dehydrogenase